VRVVGCLVWCWGGGGGGGGDKKTLQTLRTSGESGD
jgi:hypothetical protein